MNDRQQKLAMFLGTGFGLAFATLVCGLISGGLAWVLGFTVDIGLIILCCLVCAFVNAWAAFSIQPDEKPIIEKKEEDLPNDDDLGTP